MQDPVQQLDTLDLEARVKQMYTRVAEDPHGEFHFEMGRDLALRLGYSVNELDAIPGESVDSFAGVGYHFAYADIKPGQRVLDLGSGSGMDVFIAADYAGRDGRVWGVDITPAQLEKSAALARGQDYSNVIFLEGHIESFKFEPASLDVIISNGVINLSSDKASVFVHAASLLKPGGKLALSDIVTEVQLPQSITCNASLWAACIGGAMQRDDYFSLISRVGMSVIDWNVNEQYGFVSKSAQGATGKYDVKSISLVAIKN
jgi:arsenite methyltransferase